MSLENNEYLPAALHQLDDAIAALTAPQHRTHRTGNTTRIITKPSLYNEMLDSTRGEQGTAFGGAARSMPPVWIDGLDWINKVDNTTRDWWPENNTDTPTRLGNMHQASWRPQDTEFLTHTTTTINNWVTTAEHLLDGGREQFSLTAPCPACGEKWAHQTDPLGEHIRTPALTVTNLGCNCTICGHHWAAEYFTHLAKVINCTPLEGVLQ